MRKIASNIRTFIDDISGICFKYSLSQIYTNGKYHINIYKNENINNLEAAHEAAKLVEYHRKVEIWSLNEGHFK